MEAMIARQRLLMRAILGRAARRSEGEEGRGGTERRNGEEEKKTPRGRGNAKKRRKREEETPRGQGSPRRGQ
ncbi:MAG: hypothetical protein ACE5F1_14935 [Planctomycetota bacterium]